MGDPLLENKCIVCGTGLIDLTTLWGMCSGCTKKMKQKIVEMRQKKVENEHSPRRFKMLIPKIIRNV